MSQYSYVTKPTWTPGPMGNHADELARVTASPKGWIYTPAAPNAAQVEVLVAINNLTNKASALTDAGTVPTFTAVVTSDGFVTANITAATWALDVATITAVGHGLTSDTVTVAGVTPAAYNGTFVINVVDVDTFTYALVVADPGAGTVFGTASRYALATGDVVTVTLTASEAVNVAGTPYIVVDMGAFNRNFAYDTVNSTDTSLLFKYTVVAGDVATATQVTVPASLTFGTYDGVGDKLTATGGTNWLASVTYTAPNTTLITVN